MSSLHDKVMESIRRDEENNKALEAKVKKKRAATGYAGFWIRAFASVLDTVVFIMLAAIAGLILVLLFDFIGIHHPTIRLDLMALCDIILFLLYYPHSISTKGGTFVKRLLGLSITDESGQNISFRKALNREFAKIISGLPFLIGFLMAAFDKEKRALHDRICKTRVMKSSAE